MQSIQYQTIPDAFNIAVVTSRFNHEITEKLHAGAMARLSELGFDAEQITSVWVPGAVELPITAQRLAETHKYEAIIVLGAVIEGETRHFDYVCQQTSLGCSQVSLKHNIPVIFGVLTTQTEELALARAGGDQGHIGQSAVNTAYELISVLRQIEG